MQLLKHTLRQLTQAAYQQLLAEGQGGEAGAGAGPSLSRAGQEPGGGGARSSGLAGGQGAWLGEEHRAGQADLQLL